MTSLSPGQRVRALRGNAVTFPQKEGDTVKIGDEGVLFTCKHYPLLELTIWQVKFDSGVVAWGEEDWFEVITKAAN
jgi:hypothetical protein